jgi:hypothetical protein
MHGDAVSRLALELSCGAGVVCAVLFVAVVGVEAVLVHVAEEPPRNAAPVPAPKLRFRTLPVAVRTRGRKLVAVVTTVVRKVATSKSE